MANYSITVSNTFNIFGGTPTNRWGSAVSGRTLVWQSVGASTFENLWGTQEDFELLITKGISNSLNFATDPQKSVTKQVIDSIGLSSTVGKKVTRQIDESLSVANTMSTLTKQNNDWNYIFPGETDNAIDQAEVTWSVVSGSSSTWATAAAAATTWTEA